MPKPIPQENLLHAQGLRKTFNGVTVVDGVSLTLKRGEVVGLMGPNGAGKSTTMRMLAGFLSPDEGDIFIGGTRQDITEAAARKEIGYLPEQGGFYAEETAGEYLHFIAGVYAIENPERTLGVVTALTRCKEFLNRPMESLSKGMRQRVFLAAALLHEPKVLLLDEPTDGLDPNQRYEMRLLLRHLARTKTVLISTHMLEEAHAVCDRILLLHKGRIIANETPQTLADREGGDLEKAFRALTAEPFAEVEAAS